MRTLTLRCTATTVLVASLALLPACRMNERLSGTVFGGVGGLALGAAIGGVGGALLGGAGGALAGYLIGDYIADTRERGRSGVFNDDVGGLKVVPEHVRLAQAAYETGRQAKTAPEAKRWYEESLRLSPHPAPLNLLALNALFAGDRGAAERYLEEALALDPDYEPAVKNLERIRRYR